MKRTCFSVGQLELQVVRYEINRPVTVMAGFSSTGIGRKKRHGFEKTLSQTVR